jgi:hypothetical protein
MCRLVAINDMSSLTPREVFLTTRAIHREMISQGQFDGFGFSISDKFGGRFIQRYSQTHLFRDFNSYDEWRDQAGDFLEVVEWPCMSSGSLTEPNGPAIFHGRTATSEVSLRNTHPFSKEGWDMCHNGIVDYYGAQRPKYSSCDSEDILNAFVYGEGLKEIDDNFTGYMAIIAITPDGELFVARDASTPLHLSKVGEMYVFSTNPRFARVIANTLRKKFRLIGLVKGQTAYHNNQVIKFDGPTYTKSYAKHAVTTNG